MPSSSEQGYRRLMQDLRDFTFKRLSYLVGSTEQVSGNLEELAAQDRWERDVEIENPHALTLNMEIAMAKEELRRSREWMWDARGLPVTYALARQTALQAIQTLRGLRWERAQLGGTQ